MAMFTRASLDAIAETFRANASELYIQDNTDGLRVLFNYWVDLADVLRRHNPRLNRGKFFELCFIEPPRALLKQWLQDDIENKLKPLPRRTPGAQYPGTVPT